MEIIEMWKSIRDNNNNHLLKSIIVFVRVPSEQDIILIFCEIIARRYINKQGLEHMNGILQTAIWGALSGNICCCILVEI